MLLRSKDSTYYYTNILCVAICDMYVQILESPDPFQLELKMVVCILSERLLFRFSPYKNVATLIMRKKIGKHISLWAFNVYIMQTTHMHGM